MNHTPGPWVISNREILGPVDSGIIVARLPEWGILADEPDPAEKNAFLIAACPDMLFALREALAFFDGEPVERYAVENVIRSAIAKATGAA